ncbi:2-oxoglutarate dehydrogenase E1 component [Macrococcus carouselicus]|uniref:oxoglutarate dehydrogenase (succinyl-transferring) n=1 Tax=Macrococcus carouselicus TaxID=69969 RepID=A0A9Q8FR91_9STAP|nr:2-oxoglutarate dehydrogenase E1 component [Macrococcus carouselicus]TDM04221.1 2-oxoglutarate dehydrogenase E1 component [Macrococcus carouselicus]
MNKKNLEEAPIRFGANLGYLLEMADQYNTDPSSVTEEMQQLFAVLSTGKVEGGADAQKLKSVLQLIDNIRQYGHLKGDIYPLYKREYEHLPKLTPEEFNLTSEDLRSLPARFVSEKLEGRFDNAEDAIHHLDKVYMGSIGYEMSHINNADERQWLIDYIETEGRHEFTREEKIELLKSLAHVEGFEKYIHKNFVGAKRFSIEGVDALVPMLEKVIAAASDNHISNVQIGMAHRGRLNVLTHILEKPYEMMLAEFMHVDPFKFLPEDGSLHISRGWTGDVKYHLGGTKKTTRFGSEQVIELAKNPSHLEIVAPVVLGKTRAVQDSNEGNMSSQDVNRSLAVLIHGDAAFPGQGINFESMNLSNLDGYSTGGSLHIITNNRVGFTTECYDSRSTNYATDIAKGYDMPIVHVNADDIEACIDVIILAMKFRQAFNHDFVIDLVGYRRYGHNEMDEPSVTNPMMYKEVKTHPSIEILYGKQLVAEGILSDDEMNQIFKDVEQEIRTAHDAIDKNEKETDIEMSMPAAVAEGQPEVETGVERARLEQLNQDMLTYPDGFEPFSKLTKILERRQDPFIKEGLIDWGHAELLAFGTIIQDGKPVRLTGQDSERGTFAQRHAVLSDENTGEKYTPLNHISGANASFAIHNSPLSEAAVVGFEYGYNVENKNAMTVWEAQYGDFSNMAQMMFDNFISSANAKWGETSGMTLLLPHAYEGQGPEHSSARLERYLQLAAENNWTVANLTSTSNYFHLLRKQAHYLNTDHMRPLVLMTPKSLLRNTYVARPVEEFTEGQFRPVIVDAYKKTKVKKVLIASGKVAIDLYTELQKNPNEGILLIRLEQLYPLPTAEIQAILSDVKNASEIGFVQEEPQNQGAWHYIYPELEQLAAGKKVQYYGRVKRSSTSEGDNEVHKLVQSAIIQNALTI